MSRSIPARVLFVLASLALAVPSSADSMQAVGARLFDGAAGGPVQLPPLKFTPHKPQAAAAPSEQHTKQDGSDLFYFTPQEAKEAAKKFGVERARPHTDDYVFDSDVPADIQTQMRADLGFMAGIQGDGATPLHQQIFGQVDGATYKKWFLDRVTGIGMNGCGNGNAVACVIPWMDSSKMWLTKNYIQFSHPQIARLMVVYHEARHTESQNGNWPHASCPTPFQDAGGNDMKSIWTGALLQGEPACDTTAFGSYGSSTILLKNIQLHCTNCTDKVKMDAGLYADDQMGRIIDAGARRQMEEDFKQ